MSEGSKFSLARWLISIGRLASVSRMAAILGGCFAIAQMIDVFNLANLHAPCSFLAFLLFALLIGVTVELVILWAHQSGLQSLPKNSAPPEQQFAQSVVFYASFLASSRCDDAVIELRAWASRFLHLSAMRTERQKLGEIALRSALAKSDRVTQASILIDDLGWTMYEEGQTDRALENISEAIGVIDRERDAHSTSNDKSDELLLLKVKALRHKANIRAASATDLETARAFFSEPRSLVEDLPENWRKHHFAQLNHSEASAINAWLNRFGGNQTRFDPASTNGMALTKAISLAEQSERAFRAENDIEREYKALQLLCSLLEKSVVRQPELEARARLERMRLQVARNIDIRSTKAVPKG